MKKKGQESKRSAYPIVELIWVDSFSARGWRTQEEAESMIHEDTEIISCGYLYRENKRKIVLVGSIDQQSPGNVNHYHEVPRACVRRMRVLRREAG